VSEHDTSAVLQNWVKAKRLHGLSDAHVQMARELGTNPQRLLRSLGPVKGRAVVPLAQRIEDRYVRRFGRSVPEPVIPVRQLLQETRAREQIEASERRRRKRQANAHHAEAARISLLSLRRLLPGGPVAPEDIEDDEPA